MKTFLFSRINFDFLNTPKRSTYITTLHCSVTKPLNYYRDLALAPKHALRLRLRLPRGAENIYLFFLGAFLSKSY